MTTSGRRVKALTQQILISIDKVQHNIEMAPRFDLPEDVKKLAEKEKSDNAGSKK